MPTFRYQTLAGNNGTGAAVIEAPDRAAALRQLRSQGVVPKSLEALSRREARKAAAEGEAQASKVELVPPSGRAGAKPAAQPARASFTFAPSGMSRVEMATFIRELATAVQAGLPLVQSLKTIERQMRHPRQKAMVGKIVHEVEHGRSLADACAKVGRPFGDLTISLIRAGEASGRLGEILEQTANLLDRDVKLRRLLISGSIYPAILFVLIFIAITVIVGVIVPNIIKPFAGKLPESALPLPTRIVLLVGHGFRDWWWLIGLVVVGAVFLIVRAYNTPSSRLKIDRGLLKFPMIGPVVRDVSVARFTRTLGTLVSSGLPALQSLKVTKATLGNKAMEQVVEQVCEQVSSGKTISEPMEKSGYFPSLLTQIIGLGERSGRLPQMLNQAATVFEDRTESSVKVFTSIFPIAMVLFAAVIIGFIMASVLLPLIQMQDFIG
ncbi:MAG TPA: type II secretion system F family protein [Phycisphaerales bacterium]|nr:type II secretion system F family protein [Phycisphaerales bacterium]